MARASSNFRPGVLLLALAIAVFLWGVAQGSTYLAQFQEIERTLTHWQEGETFTAAQTRKLRADVKKLREDVLLTDNPQMGFDEIVFVKRYTYQSSHYYTDFIDGTENSGEPMHTIFTPHPSAHRRPVS